MEIVGTKTVNGRVVNVWKYTDEEKEEMQKHADELKKKFEENKPTK